MNFYQFMKLTLILCGDISPALKAKCVDEQVRCFEEYRKPLSSKELTSCFKLKKDKQESKS